MLIKQVMVKCQKNITLDIMRSVKSDTITVIA